MLRTKLSSLLKAGYLIALPGCLIGMCAASATAGAPAVNSVLVTIARSDYHLAPSLFFELQLHVELPGVPSVTGVSVQAGAGPTVPLMPDDRVPSGWVLRVMYESLAAVQAAMNGTWHLGIQGPSASVSTATFNALGMADADFFGVPHVTAPSEGAMHVNPDVVFSWTPPATGPFPAYALSVNAHDASGGTIGEIISVGATSWNPPGLLVPGPATFDVGYYNAINPSLISPLSVVSGSIQWGSSQYAPPGYPASTPLVALGGWDDVSFTVADCSVQGDLNCDGVVNTLDLGILLAAWSIPATAPACGGAHPCPPDLNGDGFVNSLDLGILLAHWTL